ncbi:MAG: SpoU [Bacteroidetes bacterium]|nr:SpoU [Bacteroidota bacterium]
MEKILSIDNDRVKNVVKLAGKSRERKSQKLFVIEGARELSIALESGHEIDAVFVCFDIFQKSEYPDVLESVDVAKTSEVSVQVFQKMAYREGSDGIIALAKQQDQGLEDLRLSENPFIIVLESVEKPGNLGAILRTADAAQADAIIICDPLTDVYNPNVIRSSVGCLFSVQTTVCSSQEALEWLKGKGIKTFAAELRSADFYQNTDFSAPSAIVMGTEADGLSDFWLSQADAHVKIPMRGKIDSLNVSVSTAVLTFEAMRQRGF